MNNFKYIATIAALTLIGFLFAFTSCEQSTAPELEESFAKIKAVTPIPGAQNETMNLQAGRDALDSYFTVTLNDGSSLEGWCIEWNEPSVRGIQKGVQLYSTKGKDEWKELNYFMSIKEDLRYRDPDLTYREIQAVIWSLVDNPSFDVDKVTEYKDFDPSFVKDGKPQFNVQKVKNILKDVDEHFNSSDEEASLWDYFVIFIKNEGQTIMVSSETAFAYGNDFGTCFSEFPNLHTLRWGWSNGALSEGEYEFDLYAGAAKCNLNKGTLVGKLYIDYSDGTAKVKFEMTEESEFTNALYALTVTHLYIGNEPLPNIGGILYTVAPGLYGHTKFHNYVPSYTYTINGLSGDIYVIAHADVTGFASEPL